MKIFLDTASVTELKEGVAMGLVDGCTTNPSLIAKEKRPFRPLVEEICSIVPGDVSLEVVATDFEGMIKEGKELKEIAKNVVVKCPLTKDGLAIGVIRTPIPNARCRRIKPRERNRVKCSTIIPSWQKPRSRP